MNLFFDGKWPASAEVEVDGRPVSVTVRVSARARAYRLSLPHAGGPVLTVPKHGRWREAEGFLNRQVPWLSARLKRAAPASRFAHGERVPYRGVEHLIRATGRVRGQVEIEHGDEGPVLWVPGDVPHRARRLTDWFKAQAQAELEERVAVHARKLGVSVRQVSTRNQVSRWGSCSSSGNIAFNWKLILAPPHVLDYVAAHEVAHLVEMNHSPAFWATVKMALPDMEKGKSWLRAHGRRLMTYGEAE